MHFSFPSTFPRVFCQHIFSIFSAGKSVQCRNELLQSGIICRSSSRFFSLFGGSFSRRWERPPPSYDEALKHVNPDLGYRPPDPPPYSDTFRTRSARVVPNRFLISVSPLGQGVLLERGWASLVRNERFRLGRLVL